MTTRYMARVSRSRRSQRGNAMVEFALAAGLLIPMVLGIFQFGYSFYIYNRLVAAVRDGARYASLRAYDSPTTTPSSAYLAAVQNAVVYGHPGGGDQSVLPGLTTDKVAVAVTMIDGVPDMITVKITNFSVDAVVKTMQWTNKPEASFRFEGTFQP